MDDKKINLLPEDLRSKEDKTKRPLLNFNPDFKKPGKKEKAAPYKKSGGDISWWSKMFRRKTKTPSEPAVMQTFGSSISYNDERSQKNVPASKIAPVAMHSPAKISAKVEEHIQDFVPEQTKPAKVKGPSWWSRFSSKKSAVSTKKSDVSALSNGLKYNGHSVASTDSGAFNQPVGKLDISVFQELNKQAEETDNFNLKSKKINDQVSSVVKAEPAPVPAVKPTPVFEPSLVQATKSVKIKGPSWWSKFLAWFKSKPKTQKIATPVLDEDLRPQSNNNLMSESQTKSQPAVETFRELNKQVEDTYNFDLLNKKAEEKSSAVVKPAANFDLTAKVNEEINLAPLQSIDAELSPKAEEKPQSNGFSMPEYAPKPETKVTPAISSVNPDHPAPRVTGPQFHIPEPGQKNSLLNGRVDLIPIAARVRSWKQIVTLFGFAIMLSVLILGVIYGYVIYAEQRIIAEQNKQKTEIAEIEAKILDFTELNRNISNLGKEIKLVQDTLNKHIYWTNFFALLEKYTVSDVYYSGLSVGTNGGLTLSATTKSYDSVAKQLKVLNSENAKEFVEEASITSAKKDTTGNVSFQVILTLNQSLFYYRSAQ